MRIAGIDILRGLAAFGIVGCHLSLDVRTDCGNVITALCDFNVGVFAAVAGLLMCKGKYDEHWTTYVCKRSRRLLPPYVAWSIVFIVATMVFDLLMDGGHLNPLHKTFAYWMRVVFVGGAATHLWFLACLFYAQVVLWKSFRLYDKKSHGVMWIFLGGALAYASVVVSGWFGSYPLRLTAFLMTGYGIGCYVNGQMVTVCRRHGAGLMIVAVMVLVLHIALSRWIPGFVRDWMAVGPVIVAFIGCDIRSARMHDLACLLGATSMGVYLIHPLITRGFSIVIPHFATSPYSAQVVIFDWALAWGVSLLFVLGLRRVPIVNRFI